MKGETDLSYLSAFDYTAAVLLLLTSVFAAIHPELGSGYHLFHFGKRSL
jgi:hypothetical protein